jgi:hypothetical protein
LKKAQFESEEQAIAARQDQEERRRRIDDPSHNPMPQTGLLFDLDEFDETEVFQIGEGSGE